MSSSLSGGKDVRLIVWIRTPFSVQTDDTLKIGEKKGRLASPPGLSRSQMTATTPQ